MKKHSKRTLLLFLPLPKKKIKERSLEDAVSISRNMANYRGLFVTALHIALKEKPLSDFEDLIELQQNNGLKLLQGFH